MEYAVALWVLCGIATGIIAQSRGRDAWNWLLMGLLLGPLGIASALVTPHDKTALEEGAPRDGRLRRCPYCAELIRQEGINCACRAADRLSIPDAPDAEVPDEAPRKPPQVGIPTGPAS